MRYDIVDMKMEVSSTGNINNHYVRDVRLKSYQRYCMFNKMRRTWTRIRY